MTKRASPGTAAHRRDAPVVSSRRGSVWVPGEISQTEAGTVQVGSMFVRWEAPPEESFPFPLVLIHGGGGQGTEWEYTLAGRPGWSSALVDGGFAVYVVDRVGHGRSQYHPSLLGPMGSPATYETAKRVFCPDEQAARQTQWPYGDEPGSGEIDQLVAGMGSVLSDIAYSQRVDCDRVCALLDRIGPCCLLTHSAGGPVGWLVADRRPELVKGIVAVEPVGPPFAEIPGIGALTWGLTAIPMTWSPPVGDADELRDRKPGDRTIPALADVPIAVVIGDASPFAPGSVEVAEFLADAGAAVTAIDLASRGIRGNGHGIMVEANADQTVIPVAEWLRSELGGRSAVP